MKKFDIDISVTSAPINLGMKWVLLLCVMLMASFTSEADTKTYFIHNDHLGTPQVVTDENQQVVWQADYEPFGEIDGLTQEQIEVLSRFPGQYFDKETGLYYNYYRDYDPSLGRYIQSDPIGLDGGMNTYGYVLQNPINNIDPKGLDTICGKFAVWIPDSKNNGHGYCRPFRDQGSQCVAGDCVTRDPSSNTQCMQSCFSREFVDCMNPSPIKEDGKGKILRAGAKSVLLDSAQCTLQASTTCTSECQPKEPQCPK